MVYYSYYHVIQFSLWSYVPNLNYYCLYFVGVRVQCSIRTTLFSSFVWCKHSLFPFSVTSLPRMVLGRSASFIQCRWEFGVLGWQLGSVCCFSVKYMLSLTFTVKKVLRSLMTHKTMLNKCCCNTLWKSWPNIDWLNYSTAKYNFMKILTFALIWG